MPRLIRALSIAVILCACLSHAADPSASHFLIRGNIVTPDGVIANGWLDIQDGRIAHIFTTPPESAGPLILETNDFILPDGTVYQLDSDGLYHWIPDVATSVAMHVDGNALQQLNALDGPEGAPFPSVLG